MTAQPRVPRDWLAAELKLRQDKNASYSLRCFARDLNISPGLLSCVLRGKKDLSLRTARKVSEALRHSPLEQKTFLDAVALGDRAARSHVALEGRSLAEDEFRLISDWYFFATLSLMKLDTFQPHADWIADRLGISTAEADGAIATLLRLKLVRWENGRLVRTASHVAFKTDIPSHALKRSHAETLDQAKRALFNVPIDKRHVTSSTIAVNMDRYAEATKLIHEFHDNMERFLEHGPKSEAYNLNIQLVPITKPQRATAPELGGATCI